jgi:adenine-specific DNA-methyltransferase
MTTVVKALLRGGEEINPLELLDREDLIKLVKTMLGSGVALTFHGKRSALEISRRVRPRVMRREPKLHVGAPEEQAKNLLIEGENLQAMVTLYKYRGEVDLIVTDPPYNTGQQFRYNDRWDEDPNDPDLGTLVTKEDGSRHTKWIKAIMPRLQMMKAMLKPQGVIAICIDDNELFHLGMLMDEVFGEENRLAVINWQKTYAPKKATHVSSATEYVLVYARDAELATTAMLDRTDKMNARYANADNDPNLDWTSDNIVASEARKDTVFGIQSPFTGQLHYPEGELEQGARVGNPTHHWRLSRKVFKVLLEAWGSEYIAKNLGDGRGNALILKGSNCNLERYDPGTDAAVQQANAIAMQIRDENVWPKLFFLGETSEGRPRLKRYLKDVAQGRISWTYWADEDYETPMEIGAVSWPHGVSGHSQAGLKELEEIVGKRHGFQTVKPLKLIKKIIQIWCPSNGLVLDPYAGSGTTAHAVLELNHDTGSNRRFVLIEQGRPENGDKYARTLMWQRLHNAITGDRPSGNGADPLGGGFEFRMLTRQIDAKTVLSMKKDELVDVVITSHWDESRRGSPNLIRVEDPKYTYLVGKDDRSEGYFIIWNNGGPVGQLDRDTYRLVLKDAEKAALKPPYHVYARYEIYQSPNVQFWKIPDKILAHLGLNENSDRFNEEGERVA